VGGGFDKGRLLIGWYTRLAHRRGIIEFLCLDWLPSGLDVDNQGSEDKQADRQKYERQDAAKWGDPAVIHTKFHSSIRCPAFQQSLSYY
jgi:hypothetical protein